MDWAYTLVGRSGEGMNGMAALSFTTIRHWREEMGIARLDPMEVSALVLLDAAIRHPEERKDADKPAAPAPVVNRWPTKKVI